MNPKASLQDRRRTGADRILGIGWLIFGAVFLFDPFIGLFDLLPDCLGFLFFSLGLRRIADLDDRLGDALRTTQRLALLGVARLLAVFLGYGLVSATEQPVFILLALFVMAVLDLLLVIPLWKNVCGGLLYLGSRHEATAVFDRTGRGDRPHTRSLTERYTAYSITFFVLREALAVLPELTVLTHRAGGADTATGGVLYEFVGLFRLIGEGTSLILGVLWLIMTVRFFRRLAADAPFMTSLSERYRTEILPRNDLFATRAVKSAMLSLSAAALCTVDLYVGGINILPDFLVAVLLILSLVFLRRYAPPSPLAVATAAVYGALSTASWVLGLGYFTTEDMELIDIYPAYHERWQTVSLLQGLTEIAFFAAVLCTLRAVFGLAKRYTGVAALHEGSTYATNRTSAIHLHLRRKLIAVAVLAAISAMSAVAFWAIIPRLPDLVTMGEPSMGETLGIMVYELLREAYWFIHILVCLAFFGTTLHATREISEQMEYSRMMR